MGYTKDIIDIFRKSKNFPRLAKLIITEHPLGVGKEEEVDNLSLARISLTNKGNQDIASFTFGITMEGTNKAVDIRMKEPDRHHVMSVSFPTDTSKPVTNLDFKLEPFNREETYGLDVYFTYKKLAGAINLSSPHSTVFTKLTTSTNRRVVVMAPSSLIYNLIGALIAMTILFGAFSISNSWEALKAFFLWTAK